MSLQKENYNIYDFISFSLINATGRKLFSSLNAEYKSFYSEKQNVTHFEIIITKELSDNFQLLSHNQKVWGVDFSLLQKEKKIKVGKKNPKKLDGLSFFLKYKNLYVRSVISTQLVKSNASLVHSAAFVVNDKTFILAGRPGVFKTSILMDAIREYGGQFLGEENCLIHKGLVYPFPLNIDSIGYKIKKYKDENPSGKFQKILLGLHLIFSSRRKKSTLDLPKPSKINNICYLSKGDNFSIKKVTLEEIMPDLIENELLELSIPPTHTLSGINYNYFSETISKIEPNFLNEFKSKLEKVFMENFIECNVFRITSPQKYSRGITEQIINTVTKDEK